MNAVPGTLFARLHVLIGYILVQKARVFDYTWLERLAMDTYSSLVGPFVGCEENEVLSSVY
jgi:hypothetical protein